MTKMLLVVIRLYQLFVSPLLGPRCRFTPSCSNYAVEAVTAHGAFAGSWLALRRLLRCHPWGGAGYDPVPACGCAPGALRCDSIDTTSSRDPKASPV